MLDAKLINSLPELEPPVLTVYLDTNPANPRNQGVPSGARIWLKSRAREIGATVPREERKLFRKQLERVDKFLETRPKRERGVAIFAGPKAWHALRLQVEVQDELHWGRASLKQLLWLLDEHQPCGVAVVDRSGVRFYCFWMGEVEEQKAERFELKTSQWRKNSLVRPSRTGKHKTGRSERDAFEQRVDMQYGRILRETAKRIQAWAQREKLDAVFVAGPDEAVESVGAEMPHEIRERVALVKGECAQLSAAQLQEGIAPVITQWKRAQEAAHVAEIVAHRSGARAVLGIDETLLALQQGRARAFIVARGLKGRLRQCAKCGWTDRSADRVCPGCGGERRAATLRETLPELARRFSVPVEVVAGKASTELKGVGGLAAWLR
jgi:peptide subunit release factor 1 (eRF1)